VGDLCESKEKVSELLEEKGWLTKRPQ